MDKINILWIDDEIDLLKVHIYLLEEKGFHVFNANNVNDGEEIIAHNNIDLVFLDENMPGISGLEFLPSMKKKYPHVPVVMVTKREEEDIMEEAIGNNIDGFLIKPVNPNQILLTIKKLVQGKQIISEKTSMQYQTSFNKLSSNISIAKNFDDWVEIYKEIVYWEKKLELVANEQLLEIIKEQKKEANKLFAKYISKNYVDWFSSDDHPPFIYEMMKEKVLPLIRDEQKVFLIVIDNLRYDQWKELKASANEYLNIKEENIIMTILPSVTQYARNSFFSGYLPLKIAERYPELWRDEEDEGNKNDFEFQLVKEFFNRQRVNLKINFEKIFNDEYAYNKLKNVKALLNYDLNVFIFNFVDIVSHAKTNIQMIKDIARDNKSYRNLVKLWFEDSYLQYLLKELQGSGVKIVLTTDHGSVMVENPIKVVGDKTSSTNIRYKQGKNLNYNPKEVFMINDPKNVGLPQQNFTTKYIFSKSYDYMVYPKNFHEYVKYFKNTFQHGGISMEELLIPFVIIDG